jgi:ribosomal protein L34E
LASDGEAVVKYIRRREGHYECTQCGEVLDLAPDVIPRVVVDDSHVIPKLRILNNTGKEVHHCEIRAR